MTNDKWISILSSDQSLYSNQSAGCTSPAQRKYQLPRRCVGVYNKESSKQKHRHASTVATMARRMIQSCFLLLVVYFANCCCGQDVILLTNSVIALQSQTQQMMTEIATLRQQAASTNKGKDCSISFEVQQFLSRKPINECVFLTPCYERLHRFQVGLNILLVKYGDLCEKDTEYKYL